MFSPIAQVVAALSLGPASAQVVQVNTDTRYARVQPYNFYLVNDKKSIFFLLTATRVPPKIEANAVQLSQNGAFEFVSIPVGFDDIDNLLASVNPRKFVLFTEVKAYTLEQLVNRMLEMGIFAIE